MPVRSLRTKKGFIWIPPTNSSNYKITVERSNGIIDDITDFVPNYEIEDGVTESIGKFSFGIWDPDEVFVNAWTGNEIFRYFKAYDPGFVTTKPLYHWKLNGDSTDNISGNNGTDTDVTYVSGKVGKAGSFNGSTSHIDLDSSVVLTTATYCSWIKTSSLDEINILAGNAFHSRMGIALGDRFFLETDTNGETFSSTVGGIDYTDGEWHHLAISRDGDTCSFYFDGSFDRSVTIAGSNEVTMLAISSISSRYFDGELDDVRIYDSALTASDITEIYNGGRGTESDGAVADIKFRGRIEKPSKRGNKLKVTGRSEGVKFIDTTVTRSFNNIETSVILKELVAAYAPGTTTVNVNVSDVSYTVSWHQTPFWDCLKELANQAGFDVYLDANLDFHFFEIGSVVNTTDAIVHDFNLLEIGDFTPDLTQVRNRVIVYGAKTDGIQIIHTEEQKTGDYSITSDFGVHEDVIENTDLITQTQAEEFAQATLNQKQDPPILGDVKGTMLATVQPGESVRLSSPADGIQPKNYQCIKYKDMLVNSGLQTTTVTITKEPRKIYHIMQELLKKQNEGKEVSINPTEMRFTYNFLFDINSGTHTNTEITNGVLKLSTGQSSGNWVSPELNLSTDIDQAFLLVIGGVVTGATFEVSGDNGINYQSISDKELIAMSTAKGKILRLRVNISSTATEIDSLSLQYTRD